MSDIRVTFGGGGVRREKDCVQKVYPVGQYLAAGFAGALGIGFEIIRLLQDALIDDDSAVRVMMTQGWNAKDLR